MFYNHACQRLGGCLTPDTAHPLRLEAIDREQLIRLLRKGWGISLQRTSFSAGGAKKQASGPDGIVENNTMDDGRWGHGVHAPVVKSPTFSQNEQKPLGSNSHEPASLAKWVVSHPHTWASLSFDLHQAPMITANLSKSSIDLHGLELHSKLSGSSACSGCISLAQSLPAQIFREKYTYGI
ncbi:uncharacterized protein LY79DRAFT_547442 [Colletotrichum navitas]|uniref:Uncharacterized protein n=1 Tax=Colletotrichum navitas TaxID=681940 RepID=A0AAD8V848_9PEZI|nr:uncharacterized protein LY79DRAFT_547442 [Colletotrichum navitas]KAK1595341.1 hypothetical protein LY79DRAFT_547442 [Colletotrichum navitas]